MAVVRITERLIEEICEIYKRQSDLSTTKPYPNDWFDCVYNILVPENVYNILKQLPDDFVSSYLDFRIIHRGVYFHLIPPKNTTRIYYQPLSIPRDLVFGPVLSGPIRPNFAHPAWRSFLLKADAYVDDKLASAEELVKQCASIKSKLRSYKSLASTLKDNPGLWHILPDWAKEQHELDKPRKQRKPRTVSEPYTPDVTLNATFNEVMINTLNKKLGEA